MSSDRLPVHEQVEYRGFRIESRYMGDGDFSVEIYDGDELVKLGRFGGFRYWSIEEAKADIDRANPEPPSGFIDSRGNEL